MGGSRQREPQCATRQALNHERGVGSQALAQQAGVTCGHKFATSHRSSAKVAETLYKVKRGDCLSGIALAHYGSSRAWQAIAEVNGITDTKHLTIGQRLRLPPVSQSGPTSNGAAIASGGSRYYGTRYYGISVPVIVPDQGLGDGFERPRDGWVQFKYDLKKYKFKPVEVPPYRLEFNLIGEVYLRPKKTMDELHVEISPKDWSLKLKGLEIKGDAKLTNLESIARKVCLTVFEHKGLSNFSVKAFIEQAKKGSGESPVKVGWSVDWESGRGNRKSSFSAKAGLFQMRYAYKTTADLDFPYQDWVITGSSVGYEIVLTEDTFNKITIEEKPEPFPKMIPIAVVEVVEAAAAFLIRLAPLAAL